MKMLPLSPFCWWEKPSFKRSSKLGINFTLGANSRVRLKPTDCKALVLNHCVTGSHYLSTPLTSVREAAQGPITISSFQTISPGGSPHVHNDIFSKERVGTVFFLPTRFWTLYTGFRLCSVHKFLEYYRVFLFGWFFKGSAILPNNLWV